MWVFQEQHFFDTLFVTHRGSYFFFNHMYKLFYRKFNFVSPSLHGALIVTSACPSVVYRLASRSVGWSDCHDLLKKDRKFHFHDFPIGELVVICAPANFLARRPKYFQPTNGGERKPVQKLIEY